MISINSYYYEPSDNALVQGGQKKIQKYQDKGYYIKSGSNGSYIMVKPSEAIVYFDVDGKKHSESVKELIRDNYGVKNVTEKKLETFVSDCNSGKIDLKYSDSNGLYI